MSNNQSLIERRAGIDLKTATYMMNANTSKAKNAMSLLKMAVDCYEEGVMALLIEAVEDCKKDILRLENKVGTNEWALKQIGESN